MSFRTALRSSPFAMLFAGSLGVGALAGCASRSADPGAGPAPAPTESPRAGARNAADGPTASGPASTTPAPAAVDSAVAATTPANPAPSAAPAAAAADSGWLQYDPATKTVTFRLIAGPFDWNGYTGGGATLTVPPGTANVINFEQDDGTPHSAEISSGTGPIPNSGGNPAIPRAYTNKVVEGLVQGSKDVIKFTAPDSGTYRLICGVPGHALSGMWIWYKIDPAATAPSFGPTKP